MHKEMSEKATNAENYLKSAQCIQRVVSGQKRKGKLA